MFLHHLAVFNSVALSSLGFVLPDSSTWSSFVGFKIHSFQFEVDRSFSTLFPGFVAATPRVQVLSFPFVGFRHMSTRFLVPVLGVLSFHSLDFRLSFPSSNPRRLFLIFPGVDLAEVS